MNCYVCNQEIPVLRLKALPNTTTCVKCSDVAPKRGRILSLGEGDHNYNEIEILDSDTYRRVMYLEGKEFYDKDEAPLPMSPLEDEEECVAPSVSDILKKYQDDESNDVDVSEIEKTED